MELDQNTHISNDDILHPGSKVLFRYWESLRNERSAPLRTDIDLKHIKPVVPHLFIMERHPLKQSYRWRLSGTSVNMPWRRELTGETFGEDWPEFERAAMLRLFDSAVIEYQPGVARFELNSEHGDAVGAEILSLPVQVDHTNLVQIIGAMHYFRKSAWLGRIELQSIRFSRSRLIWTEPGHADLTNYHAVPLHPKRKDPARFRVIEGGLTD